MRKTYGPSGSAYYHHDLTSFHESLEAAGSQDADRVTERIMHMLAEGIAEEARKRAPRDTGELANSIEVRYGRSSAQVVATAPHAFFLEFGTWSKSVLNPRSGTYTIRPKKPGGVLRFTGSDGDTVFAKKVEHPGIAPRPFLGPAHDEVLSKYMDIIGNAAVLMVVQ